MGYVFRQDDARRYDEWLQSEPGRLALSMEKELLLKVWRPSPPQSILEVGSGTGAFLDWFAGFRHEVTGIEPSPQMLEIARERMPSRVILDRGYAERLPYDDDSFDTVAIINTLEFVDDPAAALSEAIRVARRDVLLGVLNKFSMIAGQRYIERLWRPSIYQHARFFSVMELERMARTCLCGGRIPLSWRSCLSFPLWVLPYLRFIERSSLFQWHPFGHFIAMRLDLRYVLRTIQQPLFCEIHSGAGPAGLNVSCSLSPREAAAYKESFGEDFLIAEDNGR